MCASRSARGPIARRSRRFSATWDAKRNAAAAYAASSRSSISISRRDWTNAADQANVTAAAPTNWRHDDDGKGLHMRGDAKVIEYLNRGLRAELTAVNQYWLHYRIFDNWGFLELAEKWRKESIEEMIHADHFTKRILFLEG